MRLILLGMLAMLLSGCVITDRETLYYSRADIDALNAEAQCKALARNLVQISRCSNRR